MKIYLASRPENMFVTRFNQCLGLKIHEHTGKDNSRFAGDKLENALSEVERRAQERDIHDLANQVSAKSSGVFIWVRLAVEELARGFQNGTPVSALQYQLSQILAELKDLYHRIIMRVDPGSRPEGLIMIKIVLASRKQLRAVELMDCVDSWGNAKIGHPAQIHNNNHSASAPRPLGHTAQSLKDRMLAGSPNRSKSSNAREMFRFLQSSDL